MIVCKGLDWDEVETFGAGFVFDRHPDAAVDVIHRAAQTKKEAWNHMAEKARSYAEQRLDIRVTAEQVWNTVIGRVSHE